MTMVHPELQAFRDELRTAVEADVARQRGRRRHVRRAVGFGVPAAVAAATLAICLVLTVGAEGGVSPADAAVLASARNALTQPVGSILHVAAEITVGSSPAQPYQLWASDTSYRFIKFGAEGAWNGSTMSSYDAASNTIYVGVHGPSQHARPDIAATIRSLLASGQATVEGSSVVDGVPADVLSLSGLPAGQGVANGTYDVAKSDYRPLLLQTTVPCAQGSCAETETVRYTAYEYLPGTPANLSLLDLQAQHPGATVVQGNGDMGVGSPGNTN
jgi:hypothetical protein